MLESLPDDELVKQMHDDLYDGLADEIVRGTEILLERGWTAEKTLGEALVEGMRIVGIDFRDGILFVPEVLLAANAMKAGMEVLRPLLSESSGRGAWSASSRWRRSTSGTKIPSRKSMPTIRVLDSASLSVFSALQPRSSRISVPRTISVGEAVVEVVVLVFTARRSGGSTPERSLRCSFAETFGGWSATPGFCVVAKLGSRRSAPLEAEASRDISGPRRRPDRRAGDAERGDNGPTRRAPADAPPEAGLQLLDSDRVTPPRDLVDPKLVGGGDRVRSEASRRPGQDGQDTIHVDTLPRAPSRARHGGRTQARPAEKCGCRAGPRS